MLLSNQLALLDMMQAGLLNANPIKNSSHHGMAETIAL